MNNQKEDTSWQNTQSEYEKAAYGGSRGDKGNTTVVKNNSSNDNSSNSNEKNNQQKVIDFISVNDETDTKFKSSSCS